MRSPEAAVCSRDISRKTEKRVPEMQDVQMALRRSSSRNGRKPSVRPIITAMFASPSLKNGSGLGMKSSSEERKSEREERYMTLSRDCIYASFAVSGRADDAVGQAA